MADRIRFLLGETVVGSLEYESGVLTFEGDVDESAMVLVDCVAVHFEDRLRREREPLEAQIEKLYLEAQVLRRVCQAQDVATADKILRLRRH